MDADQQSADRRSVQNDGRAAVAIVALTIILIAFVIYQLV